MVPAGRAAISYPNQEVFAGQLTTIGACLTRSWLPVLKALDIYYGGPLRMLSKLKPFLSQAIAADPYPFLPAFIEKFIDHEGCRVRETRC
jgi:hypothetical protein